MGRITSNIGLITGVPITDTVNQLLALEARPRDLIVNRNKTLDNRSLALSDITAAILRLQLRGNSLSRASLFRQTQVTSSNTDLITVSGTSTTPVGHYSVTPIRLAQSQRLTSSAIASDTAALGGGTFSLRFGGFVNTTVPIDALNGGAGIDRGEIRITDRSGATTVVDLRLANSVEDVINAINENGQVRVRVEGNGDRFRVYDQSVGSPVGNLRIEDVGTGTTAASLGLNVDVAADVADGGDVLWLYEQLALNQLNGGGGIGFDEALADLSVSLGDGTQISVDFKRIPVLGGIPAGTTTAAGGDDARVTISANQAGTEFADVDVSFVADTTLTRGNEVVTYDADNRTLVFRFAEGETTASDIVAALENSQIAGADFTAKVTNGGSGSGLVDASDTAHIGGLYAEATTPGAGTGGVTDPNARIRFVVDTSGPSQNGIAIEFAVDAGLAPGGVSVDYKEKNETLRITISDGQTTAADVIAAVNGDATVSQNFTASLASGSDGTGVVVSDDAVTTAGAVIESIDGTDEFTLADVLATINSVAPDKLRAEISPDGDSIRLIDLSTNAGQPFSVQSLGGSTAAEDLGFIDPAVGDTIGGRRILAGIDTTLLRDLGGGAGIGPLTSIQIEDRSGASTTVDLSQADTLQDVLGAINDAAGAAGVAIRASVNRSRSGILVTDTSLSTAGNLVIANVGADDSADRLGIAIDAAVSRHDGDNLHRQVVFENTLLSTLNGGAGVSNGSFKIENSQGTVQTINISSDKIDTVGDVILEINRLQIGITASLNAAGDGILLTDTAGGSGDLTVTEGVGTTARDLHLLADGTSAVPGGPITSIDGSTTYRIELDEEDSLQDLVSSINDLDAGFSAAVVNTGSAVTPYRLVLTSKVPGQQGALLVDASDFEFDFHESSRAQDSLLLLGSIDDVGRSLFLTSSDNRFDNALPGVSINVHGTSTSAVSITSTKTDEDLVSKIELLVEAFNDIQASITDFTGFDPETGDSGILHGERTIIRVQGDLGRLLTGALNGAGTLSVVNQVGLRLGPDGTLSFDAEKLREVIAKDPEAVEQFFTAEEFGFAARLDKLTNNLATDDNSLLISRLDSLTSSIRLNNERIDFLNERLERTRQRLINQFVKMEEAIARIQENLSAITSIQALPPLE